VALLAEDASARAALASVGALYGLELSLDANIGGWGSHQRLRVVDTRAGRMFALKQRPPYLSKDEFAVTVEAHSLASDCGLAADLIRTHDGGHIANADGDSWILSAWTEAPGTVEEDLPALARSLGRLHRSLVPLAPQTSWSSPEMRWLVSPDSVEYLVRLVDATPIPFGLSVEIGRAARSLGEPGSPSRLTAGVIHGDAAFDNALVLNGDVHWIDFDNCRRGRLAWDLLHLVSHAAVVRLINNDDANLDAATVRGFLNDAFRGYSSADGLDLGIGQMDELLGPLGLALIVAIISQTNLDDPQVPSHVKAEELLATVLSMAHEINGN
jgi:Ser/Thr protein kinase RdoA (MazF antagonist)